jgi:hypothetical protein
VEAEVLEEGAPFLFASGLMYGVCQIFWPL